jgi:hypothetical protein
MAPHGRYAVQRMDDNVGVEQQLHSFGGLLLFFAVPASV